MRPLVYPINNAMDIEEQIRYAHSGVKIDAIDIRMAKNLAPHHSVQDMYAKTVGLNTSLGNTLVDGVYERKIFEEVPQAKARASLFQFH